MCSWLDTDIDPSMLCKVIHLPFLILESFDSREKAAVLAISRKAREIHNFGPCVKYPDNGPDFVEVRQSLSIYFPGRSYYGVARTFLATTGRRLPVL